MNNPVIINDESDIPDHLNVPDSGFTLLERSGYCFAWNTEEEDSVLVKYEGESLMAGRDI